MIQSMMSFTAPEGRFLQSYQFCGDLALGFVQYHNYICDLQQPHLYSCRAAAEGNKYNFDIGQIQEPNHHKIGKADHFQVNFEGNGLLEQ